MRLLLVLSAMVLLSTAATACGHSAGTGSTSHVVSRALATTPGQSGPSSASTGSYFTGDGDRDRDEAGHAPAYANDDVPFLASYGKEASRVDKQVIGSLIKRYYAAALAEDGTTGCSLLYPSLASGLGQASGQGASAGKSCAMSLSLIFKQRHTQLIADDIPAMVLISVRLKGDLGLAELGFRTMPRGEILLARAGNAWKIDALLDGEMT